MLYCVRMDVQTDRLPGPEELTELKKKEKRYCQKLQQEGKWRHIWRVTGKYANISIFDAASNDELHEILWGLPLFPYMMLKVTALSQHTSAIEAGGSR